MIDGFVPVLIGQGKDKDTPLWACFAPTAKGAVEKFAARLKFRILAEAMHGKWRIVKVREVEE